MTLRETLGRVGLWSPRLGDAAGELDALGWRTLWLPGAGGGLTVLDDVDRMLAAAPRARVVTGVLNILGQSPAELSERVATLDAAHGARTVLGLGVGSLATNPIEAMGHYLDGVSPSVGIERRLLGALGPRMVDLAVARTAGWHPFLVTADYIATERARVGPEPVIAPYQAVYLGEDPGRARTAARDGIGMFLGFPTYQANLRRMGFGDDDLVPGGSDRLIDALVAHGTVDDIARRVRDQLDAGADHIAIHVLNDQPLTPWRDLADALSI